MTNTTTPQTPETAPERTSDAATATRRTTRDTTRRRPPQKSAAKAVPQTSSRRVEPADEAVRQIAEVVASPVDSPVTSPPHPPAGDTTQAEPSPTAQVQGIAPRVTARHEHKPDKSGANAIGAIGGVFLALGVVVSGSPGGVPLSLVGVSLVVLSAGWGVAEEIRFQTAEQTRRFEERPVSGEPPVTDTHRRRG